MPALHNLAPQANPLTYADAVAIVTAERGPRPERIRTTLQTTYLSSSDKDASDLFRRVLSADNAGFAWDRAVSSMLASK